MKFKFTVIIFLTFTCFYWIYKYLKRNFRKSFIPMWTNIVLFLRDACLFCKNSASCILYVLCIQYIGWENIYLSGSIKLYIFIGRRSIKITASPSGYNMKWKLQSFYSYKFNNICAIVILYIFWYDTHLIIMFHITLLLKNISLYDFRLKKNN